MRMLLTSLILCMGLIPINSLCQEVPLGAQMMEVNGIEGMWIPMPMARSILSDVKKIKNYEQEVSELKFQLSLKDRRILFMKDLVSTKESTVHIYKTLYIDTSDQLWRLRKSKNPWYKNSVFLVSVGAAVLLVAQIGGAQMFKAVR